MKRRPVYELEDLGPSRMFTPRDERQLLTIAVIFITLISFPLVLYFTGAADGFIEKAATLYLWLK